EGTDCHYENVVASGEHPMLIDLETLLHHRTKNYYQLDTNARWLADKKLSSSVLQSLILPRWGMFGKCSLALDLSALGATEEQRLIGPKVQKINTDKMYVGSESYLDQKANIPKLRDEPLNARNYLSDIILGFRQMYDFLGDHRETLLAADSPLHNFARHKVRYVFRPTRIYHIILNNSFHPDLLQSGIDRSISIDLVSRAFITGEIKPAFWSILDAELQAIEGLDIPFFEVNTEQADIELSTGVTIPELFEESSFEAVISRLKSLNEEDLALQLEIIRGSFCARFMSEEDCIVLNSNYDSQLSKLTLTSEQLVQEAVAIAKELQQRGIYGDESVSWIGLELRPNSPGFQLQSLGNNLYDGSCGVALFLAALAKVTKNSDWQDLALKTLQPLRQDLQDPNSEVFHRLKREGIGGSTGLGSIVYSLVKISHFI
ncbi:MAG: type 2 lanthipeptide synthetase LanM, partial [Waterburya sp.]